MGCCFERDTIIMIVVDDGHAFIIDASVSARSPRLLRLGVGHGFKQTRTLDLDGETKHREAIQC